MGRKNETKAEELARLEQELKDLLSTLPEHCYGTRGYTGVHHATPRHWEQIERTEERIKQLKAELGRG
jgi:archaellum component FlaC